MGNYVSADAKTVGAIHGEAAGYFVEEIVSKKLGEAGAVAVGSVVGKLTGDAVEAAANQGFGCKEIKNTGSQGSKSSQAGGNADRGPSRSDRCMSSGMVKICSGVGAQKEC